MKLAVIFLWFFFYVSWYQFDLCAAIPKQKLLPLPCWLVKGSRVHICADNDGAGSRDDGEESLSSDSQNVQKRLTDYFNELFNESEDYTSFQYTKPLGPMDWFTSALRRAMADIEISSAGKRTFDSIAYNHRFGFGR